MRSSNIWNFGSPKYWSFYTFSCSKFWPPPEIPTIRDGRRYRHKIWWAYQYLSEVYLEKNAQFLLTLVGSVVIFFNFRKFHFVKEASIPKTVGLQESDYYVTLDPHWCLLHAGTWNSSKPCSLDICENRKSCYPFIYPRHHGNTLRIWFSLHLCNSQTYPKLEKNKKKI